MIFHGCFRYPYDQFLFTLSLPTLSLEIYDCFSVLPSGCLIFHGCFWYLMTDFCLTYHCFLYLMNILWLLSVYLPVFMSVFCLSDDFSDYFRAALCPSYGCFSWSFTLRKLAWTICKVLSKLYPETCIHTRSLRLCLSVGLTRLYCKTICTSFCLSLCLCLSVVSVCLLSLSVCCLCLSLCLSVSLFRTLCLFALR